MIELPEVASRPLRRLHPLCHVKEVILCRNLSLGELEALKKIPTVLSFPEDKKNNS